MAKVYLLNALASTTQDPTISVQLNAGQPQPLKGLNSPDAPPYCTFPLGANADKSAFGVGSTNFLIIRATGQAWAVQWQIKVNPGVVTADQDIQFLIFENQLLGRQGGTVTGFTITQIPVS